MNDFRVLSLNIHKGFSMGNRRFTLEAIRHSLRQTGSNIVFLQEVIGANSKHEKALPEWPDKNQFEYLADTVWSHYAYGQNAIYQHGHHGNAILSEMPIKTWSNIDVSTMKLSQRGMLHGVLDNGINLLCIHFGLFARERRGQMERLIDYIGSEIPASAPLILAGDFNDWGKQCHTLLTQEVKLVEAHFQHHHKLAKTYPARFPLLSMDRIYVRGFNVHQSTALSTKPWRKLSDHCPLFADLSLTSEPHHAQSV